MKPYRVLVLAIYDWNDPEHLRQEFQRLASIHRKIEIVYPDDTSLWQLYVRDWCIHHGDQFIAVGYKKDVFTYGSEPDLSRDWHMLLDELPDEVWKIEGSKGDKRRPRAPIFPEIWQAAVGMGLPCEVHRNTYRKKKPWNSEYMVPAKTYRNRRTPS